MLIEDGNILPHENLLKNFHFFSRYDGDKTESGEEEIEPRQPRWESTLIIFQFLKKQKPLIGEC